MGPADEREDELRKAAQALAVKLGAARRGASGKLADAQVLDDESLEADVRRRLDEDDDRLAAFGGDVELAISWLQRVIAEAVESDS